MKKYLLLAGLILIAGILLLPHSTCAQSLALDCQCLNEKTETGLLLMDRDITSITTYNSFINTCFISPQTVIRGKDDKGWTKPSYPQSIAMYSRMECKGSINNQAADFRALTLTLAGTKLLPQIKTSQPVIACECASASTRFAQGYIIPSLDIFQNNFLSRCASIAGAGTAFQTKCYDLEKTNTIIINASSVEEALVQYNKSVLKIETPTSPTAPGAPTAPKPPATPTKPSAPTEFIQKHDPAVAAELSNQLNTTDINEMFGRIIKFIIGISGSLALLIFVYGGILWLISGGKSEQVDKGKKAMILATTGLAVIFFSYLIIKLIITALGVIS